MPSPAFSKLFYLAKTVSNTSFTMSFRMLSISSIASVALMILLIVPANAAPSMGLGSNASYNLSLKINQTQSCNASPLIYNQTACGPPVPPQPWSFRDDFNYTTISQLEAAGWGIENIAPLSYYAVGNSTLMLLNDGTVGAGAGHTVPPNTPNWSVSTRVEWIGTHGNVSGLVGSLQIAVQTQGHSYDWMADGYYYRFGLGQDGHGLATFANYTKQLNVWHVLTLNMISGTLYGYFDGLLVGTYTISDTTPGNTNLVNVNAIASWETNNKFDWLSANSLPGVPAPPLPPGPTSVFPITVSGTVGWSVVGLDTNTAVLNVTHALSVLIDNIPIAPVSESGSFQQSVDLSTRTESPGTATEFVSTTLQLLSQVSASSTGGIGMSGIPGTLGSGSNMPTMYTIWWVNGPLSNGSPVKILTGFSSVQGSENVNLPGTLGTRSAWMVTSNVDESLTSLAPQLGSLSGPINSNNAHVHVALKFDYDQSSDLLLTSLDSATVASTSSVTYSPGQILCGLSGQCTTVSSLTTVTSITTMSITASLNLSSTNLSLSKRMVGNGQSSTPAMLSNLQAAVQQPLIYVAAIAITGALASVLVSVLKRRDRRATQAMGSAQQPPSPTAPAPVA